MSGTSPTARGLCQDGASAAAVAAVRACAGSNSEFLVSGQLSLVPFTPRDTHSTPAEMNTSPSPALIAWKAIRVVCSDDEQYRVTVVPGRWSNPSMTATTRPMLKPCSPPGRPQPSMRSPASAGSSWGTLARAAVTIWQVRSSGRTVVREPLNARPIGERAVATMTASVIGPPGVVVAYRYAAYASPAGRPRASLATMIRKTSAAYAESLHDHRGGPRARATLMITRRARQPTRSDSVGWIRARPGRGG